MQQLALKAAPMCAYDTCFVLPDSASYVRQQGQRRAREWQCSNRHKRQHRCVPKIPITAINSITIALVPTQIQPANGCGHHVFVAGERTSTANRSVCKFQFHGRGCITHVAVRFSRRYVEQQCNSKINICGWSALLYRHKTARRHLFGHELHKCKPPGS